MDIELSQLPAAIAESLANHCGPIRVLSEGQAVAVVVPTERPIFRSHKALRTAVGPLQPTFGDMLREERDAG